MATEHNNNNINDSMNKYWEENQHLFPDKGVEYQENPAWKLAQTLKVPPYTPSNFRKKYFIRDLCK